MELHDFIFWNSMKFLLVGVCRKFLLRMPESRQRWEPNLLELPGQWALSSHEDNSVGFSGTFSPIFRAFAPFLTFLYYCSCKYVTNFVFIFKFINPVQWKNINFSTTRLLFSSNHISISVPNKWISVFNIYKLITTNLD